MAEMQVSSNVKAAEIQAIIIRADGTREELGTIAYYHRNPLRRLWFALTRRFQGKG